MEIGGGGLVAFCAVVSTATVIVFLFLMFSGCSSNPRDDRNRFDCGEGWYAPTKAQCPWASPVAQGKYNCGGGYYARTKAQCP